MRRSRLEAVPPSAVLGERLHVPLWGLGFDALASASPQRAHSDVARQEAPTPGHHKSQAVGSR